MCVNQMGLDLARIFMEGRLVQLLLFEILGDWMDDFFKLPKHPMTGILFQNQRTKITPPKSNVHTKNDDV